MAAESVRTGACVTSGAEKLAARAGKGGGRTGVKRRRYALPVTRMASFCMTRLQSRSLQAKTRGSAVRTRHDPIVLFGEEARICSRSASSSASRMLPSGTVGTKPTKTARRGNHSLRRVTQPQPVPSGLAGTTSANCRVVPVGPLPIGWVSSSGANCRKSSMRRSLSGSSGSIGACRR